MAPKPADWLEAIPAEGDALGNTRWSNCWEVAQAWVICLRRAITAGDTTRPRLQSILSQYTLLTGFNQLTGLPDDGTLTSDAMAQWCRGGYRINDQTLDIPHWLTVDPANDAHVAIAIGLAGPLMATWRLPIAMQDMSTWSNAPGSGGDWDALWGEHETVLGATDGAEWVTTRTWGNDLPVHPEIRRKYLIHIDVPLDLTAGGWLGTTGHSPAGLDREALAADMAKIGVA